MKEPVTNQKHSWLSERFPVSTLKKWIFKEEIPGGSRFSYSLGSAALFLFMILAVTGIWQMFVYVPLDDEAYNSLSYLRLNVPFGWLIHGLHYWGATAFSAVVGLHMIRVFIWGAYKKPRELVWLAGIVLLLLTALFMFTGPILPWDKMGYWACKVGLDMIGAIPYVGSFFQALFWGSDQMGQIILSRMFVWHVAILPSLIILFLVVHLVAFRVYGSVGPWDKKKQKVKGKFWPDQIFKDMVVSFFLFVLLVGLTVFFPPPFPGAADPLDTSYIPKPEWNFTFFYQILKYFKGFLEPIGIVGIPLLIILFFVSLPFLDRGEERNPFKRIFVVCTGIFFFLLVLFFTIFGMFSNPSEIGSAVSKPIEKNQFAENPEPQKSNPPIPPSKGPQQSASVSQGKKVFEANACNICHTITGKKSHLEGPDLVLALSQRKNLTESWLRTQILSPQKHNPNSLMPAYTHLSNQDLDALIAFLEKLSTLSPEEASKGQKKEQQTTLVQPPKEYGQSIHIVGNAEHGKTLYTLYCLSCHGPNGKIKSKGFQPLSGVPALNPINRALFSPEVAKFLQNIDIFIQHGAPNSENGPNMPDFGDSNSLTQQEIADIEAYILQMNHVNRAHIINPGIAPKPFFYIVLGISALFFIIGFFYWAVKK